MPGGGAEMFSPGVRATIADKKLGRRRLHRRAPRGARARHPHQLHDAVRPRRDDRGSHRRTSRMLRDLQDETGGFLAYIPLAYHPDNNELGVELGRHGHGDDRASTTCRTSPSAGSSSTTSSTSSRTGSWSRRSSRRLALHFGVNDLEGTVVREKIYHEAGAHTRAGDDARRDAARSSAARARSRPSATRSTTCIRTFDDDAAASRGGVTMRVGRIPYINCYPVYGAHRSRRRRARRASSSTACPVALNRRMAAGALDVSVVSAVEYARDARALSAAAGSRHLLRRPRAQRACSSRDAPAERAWRPARAREPQLDDERRAARAAVRARLEARGPSSCPATPRWPTSRVRRASPSTTRGWSSATRRCCSSSGASDRRRGAVPVRVRPRRGVEGVDRAAVRVRRLGRAAHRAGRARRSACTRS